MKTKKTKSSSSGKKKEKGSSKSVKSQKKEATAFKYPPALQYRWSDPSFIDKGYSFLPGEKSMKVVSYAAQPAKQNSVWFLERREIERKEYEDGSKFVEFYPGQKAKVYYPNGRLAILLKRYRDGFHLQVMQPGENDSSGVYRPYSIAGLFDSLGNGVIYDENGDMRICYNQREGILMDTPNGKHVGWQWPSLMQTAEPKKEPREFLTLQEVWKIYNARIEAESLDKSLLSAAYSVSIKSDASGKKSKSKLKSEVSVVEDVSTKKSSRKMAAEKKSVSGISEGKSGRVVSIMSSKASATTLQVLEKVENTMEWAASVRSRKSQIARLIKLPIKQPKPKKITPTPMKTVVLRINEYITFRLVDQENISLKFMKKVNQIRFELGVTVYPNVELRTDDVDQQFVVKDRVYCPFENYLSNTESMLKIINHLNVQRMRPRDKKSTRKRSCYNKSPFD